MVRYNYSTKMKKKLKKQVKHKPANPIFSKIDYPVAKEIKKDILELQINLLNTLQNINNYKELRKKEHMYKLKLKNNLKTVNQNIRKIMLSVPKTEGIGIAKQQNKIEIKKETPRIIEKIKNAKQQSAIELKLENIQRILQELR